MSVDGHWTELKARTHGEMQYALYALYAHSTHSLSLNVVCLYHVPTVELSYYSYYSRLFYLRPAKDPHGTPLTPKLTPAGFIQA